MRERRFAGVIAFHKERIVLVRERYADWGGDHWNIPSGMVETHETPLLGAMRELAEETGLVVAQEALELMGTSSTTSGKGSYLAWNYTAIIGNADLAVNDPDGCILEARWFTREESIERLSRLPYRPIVEPVVAYLDGSVERGSHWVYDAVDADPVITPLRRV